MKKTLVAALAAVLGTLALPARALVLIDSNDNVLAPDGYYAAVYPFHSQASQFNGSDGKKSADADFALDLLILRAFAFKHLGGIPLAFQVIQPVGRIQETKMIDGKSSGAYDFIFGPGVFLYANEATATYLSYWLYAYAPTGAYDKAKPLNLGGHHWYFEHQLAVNQTFAKKLVFDANVDFYHHAQEPDSKITQPLRFELAAILGYQFTPKLLAGVHGGAYWDLADQKQDGVALDKTAASKTAFGPALSYQLTDKVGATLRWTHDLSATNDFKGDDLWLRVAYAF